MASQDFRTDALARLEEKAREIVEALPEGRLKEAPDEASRVFLQAMRERWEPATHATDWDDDQIRAFGSQAREIREMFGGGSEVDTGDKEVPPEIDVQRLPADWAACIGDCYHRVDYCWLACMIGIKRTPGDRWSLEDHLKGYLCDAYCGVIFEMCLVSCFLPLF